MVVAPWWRPPATLITASREEVVKQYARLAQAGTTLAYTDGSGYKGGVRAAAVLGRRLINYLLGKEANYMVYCAELVGIKLALASALSLGVRELIIMTDNQATIRACAKPRRQSGQFMIR